MRYNPFRPNSLTAPGMFYGRVPEIETIKKCLYQAKNGNPVHFLIQGERGIGKSSLFMLLDAYARGDVTLGEKTKLNFITLYVDLGSAETQIDIVGEIGRELRNEMRGRDALKLKAKAFYDWMMKWEILGVRHHAEKESLDPKAAASDLITNLADLCEHLKGDMDGILILIDEADRPGAGADLGALCKLFTERLARKSCNTVIIGLAGLPAISQQLKASHESSPRLFTTMLLEPLTLAESKEVVESGLKIANMRNPTDRVSIESEALDLLASLSEGYPHFIQQFAYSAFDACEGSTITVEEVLDGAYGENGALSQLGAKFFHEMYSSKIASDDYRKVLHTMAEHFDDWVARKDLIAESGLPKSTVTNALNALKARDIILADESRKNRGFYRIPTRSFAAWLKAIESVSEQTGLPLPDVGETKNG